MKVALWSVPSVLAVCIILWLVKTGGEMAELQAEVRDAREQMAAIRPRGGPAAADVGDDAGGAGKARVITQGNRVNWNVVSDMMTALKEGVEQPHFQNSFAVLQDKLEAMDKGELYAALDEIAALGLTSEQKSALEALVVERLVKQDPQGVLLRFDDRIGNDDDDVGWTLSEALENWAGKDPLAAARWMDDRIKAGKFESKSLDGYSESRVEYESVLMSHLLGKQNMQAVERIRGLAEGDRLVVLEQMNLAELGPEAQVAYADIVRSLVPPADREGAFGYVASELVYNGGYEAVQEFLDRVKATPEEREEAAQQAACNRILAIAEEAAPTVADIEGMRNWVGAQAPGQVEQITGEAIGEAYNKEGHFGFEQAKELVLSFHGKSASDDLLIGFLSSFAGQENPQEARKMIELIQDPAKKQQMLEGLQ